MLILFNYKSKDLSQVFVLNYYITSRDFKMQTMTPTNLSNPSTPREGNENPNMTKDFQQVLWSHRCHAPHLTDIGNIHTDAQVTLCPDTSLSMLQRLGL